MLSAKHMVKRIQGDYRMIVIADIHGHLDRFKALLAQLSYDPEDDYLIILGDFVEKGDQVYDTIKYVRYLSQSPRCYVLMGNCEWALCAILQTPELAIQIPHYLEKIPRNGVIRDTIHQYHLDDGHETILGIQREVEHHLHDDLQWMKHLPTTLKINDFIFVHAGLPYDTNYKNGQLTDYLEMQRFMDQGHKRQEMVIVGHIPASNYTAETICNDIIINREKRIISIDGGVGVKPIAQLNALIIKSVDQHISYQQASIQPGLKGKAIKSYHQKQPVYHRIAYPYFEVVLLERGKSFSLCHNIGRNEDLMIKNEFLYTKEGHLYCLDDYTDRHLDVECGDVVSVVGHYGDYIYAMKDGIVGWIKADAITLIR